MAFADLVALLVTYLDGIVTPDVRGRVPSPVPDEFVQVRRVGGTAEIPVRETVRVDFFAWSTSDPAATALGNEVRDAIWALAGTNILGVPIYRVAEFKGLSTTDDPTTGQHRGWVTLDLTTRADSVVPYN